MSSAKGCEVGITARYSRCKGSLLLSWKPQGNSNQVVGTPKAMYCSKPKRLGDICTGEVHIWLRDAKACGEDLRAPIHLTPFRAPDEQSREESRVDPERFPPASTPSHGLVVRETNAFRDHFRRGFEVPQITVAQTHQVTRRHR